MPVRVTREDRMIMIHETSSLYRQACYSAMKKFSFKEPDE
jgi:hypothetical protein